MTIKQAFENCLVELNKVLAPALLLSDFIYLFNKAILEYINLRYNLFETSQLLTDDLRVLLKTIKITNTTNPNLVKINNSVTGHENVFNTNYLCTLPNDYMHILNCICEFEKTNSKCGASNLILVGANKLDTSEWPHVIQNYYMLPSIKRPYFYISNIEPNPDEYIIPTDKVNGIRYGNYKIPKMLIKCGEGINKYDLKAVYIDYLRAPEYVNLTQTELDNINDTTRLLEFPDYVVFEIINLLVALILENGKDTRILTFIPVNLSIASSVSTKS